MFAVEEDHPSCDGPFSIVGYRMSPRSVVVLSIGVETPCPLLDRDRAAIPPIDIDVIQIIVTDPPGNVAPKR